MSSYQIQVLSSKKIKQTKIDLITRQNNWAYSPQKPVTVVKVVDWQLPTIYTEGTMERFTHMANSYASFLNIATKERVF